MDPELYPVIDYILNKADDAAIEVIIGALKKRNSRELSFGGINPAGLARQTARSIQEQVGGSIDSIRDMVRDFAVDVIRKQAPELDEAQVGELLDAWVPDGGVPAWAKEGAKEGGKGGAGRLPGDVLAHMVRQFVAYSAGTMSATEQQKLHEEIPGWQERYWSSFPKRIQDLVRQLLRGEIGEELFTEELGAFLDLPGS